MADRKNPEEDVISLKFGGGIHSRASEDDIDPRECATGKNFDLDAQNHQYRNRKPFDLLGTVPNAGEIRGFASLLTSDGTVSFLVQADDTVYEWDGLTTFTSKGNVSATAKLRGRLEHNWQLDDKVIITDLNLQQPIMEWDGTTLQTVSFTDENEAAWTGTLSAKYCTVSNERAIFSNINDNGSDFPHLIVGCKRGDYTNATVTDRPSSSLSEEDPFFLIQPDLMAINGVTEAFGQMIISSDQGSLFYLTGGSSKDFAFDELFPRSGASGNEALTYVGNDILYGRQGRLESIIATQNFGDVEANDVSIGISDAIEDFTDWTIVYNSRNQRVYCVPANQSQMWVLHKPVIDTGLSPWSKWTTQHAMAMNPTAIMNMLDPQDGLEYVFMGDGDGRLYRVEGTGSGDGGSADIIVERLSALYDAPLDAEVFQIEGYISYRKDAAATVTLQFEYAGTSVFNETITITIPAPTRLVYNDSNYYNNDEYYGTAFGGRLTRQKFITPGQSNQFQIRATIEGQTDTEIHEIRCRIKTAA